MKACDRCGRTEKVANIDPVGIAMFVPDDDGETVIRQPGVSPASRVHSLCGHLCPECKAAMEQGIAAMLDVPHGSPVKSMYVMTPTRPWWVRIPLAVLLNVLQGLAYGSVFLATWYHLATHSKH